MKNISIILSLLICSGSTLTGCAGVSGGVKVYPQKVFLLVDKAANSTKILTLPDIKNAYVVKPWSFLSKHDFKLQIENAQVKELESKQDSTTALALLQKIVEIGADLAKESLKAAAAGAAAGKAVADVDMASSFGLETGVYEINESGKLVKIH